MKVTVKNNEMKFSDLKPGIVFKCVGDFGEFCIKVTKGTEHFAVELRTGIVTNINDNTLVTVYEDAEVIIH